MSQGSPVVGWVGTGRIGLPMARRVLAAGFPLAVWARRREGADALVAGGAAFAVSPAALAKESDIVMTIVGGPADVSALHAAMVPRARPGTVFVEMTTAAPANAVESQALAARFGALALDAPVTGGVAGAERGSLTAFVGGDAPALERARPVLAAFANRIAHCGAAGSGYRMKLVNQTIVAGVLLGLAGGAALARSGGLPAPAVRDALSAGTASGFLFDAYLARMMEGGGATTFTLAMLRKDLSLAREDAAARACSTRLIDFALAEVDAARLRHGDVAGVQVLGAPGPE